MTCKKHFIAIGQPLIMSSRGAKRRGDLVGIEMLTVSKTKIADTITSVYNVSVCSAARGVTFLLLQESYQKTGVGEALSDMPIAPLNLTLL